jgi:hypothetical protein
LFFLPTKSISSSLANFTWQILRFVNYLKHIASKKIVSLQWFGKSDLAKTKLVDPRKNKRERSDSTRAGLSFWRTHTGGDRYSLAARSWLAAGHQVAGNQGEQLIDFTFALHDLLHHFDVIVCKL